MNIKYLNKLELNLENTQPYPTLFLGHGTPMNAIENNIFSKKWAALKDELPTPKAIICISAHWETRGTYVTSNVAPRTIHDFYGFPKELYNVQYNAEGFPELASSISTNLNSNAIIEETDEWGLDHGTWSLLCHLYPQRNIPVIQISLNRNQSPTYHYELGLQLSRLRNKGILIIGSGNMVHNLGLAQVKGYDFNQEYGYDWAYEINEIFKQKILNKEIEDLLSFQALHPKISLAIPTAEHYLPLLYIMGMLNDNDSIQIINDNIVAGSLSMTSVIIS